MENKDLTHNFDTLSQAINELVKLGYTYDFNKQSLSNVCTKTNTALSPKDFRIDKTYRFEGDSDPEYQSILYAISSSKHDIKGVLVNGYGISADETVEKLIEQLQIINDVL